MSSLSAAINEFGLDLFKELLRHNAENNILFSPFSILTALSMVCYGTRGDTATQMRKVLHFNEDRSATTGDSSATEDEQNTAAGSRCDRPGGVYSQFQALLSQLNKPTKDYVLNIANRMYAATGFTFLPHYIHCIEELYHAGLETVDFAKETEKTRLEINKWIDGNIKEFYAPQSLSPDSVLVIVNAVFFKGMWESRFKEEETKEEPFGVNKLERSLTNKNMEKWISKMFLQPVNVHVPRFKLEERYDLNKILESMGITDVFDPRKADLSGMSKQNLVVSQVTQQTFVEVNESGTEAGAATGVGIISTAVQVPTEFRANRPFLFVIIDKSDMGNLHLGKYSSP